MIKKNDLFEAEITALTAEGSGICRADGMAVFVPGTALGDRCAVRLVNVLNKYAFGRLDELLMTSTDRTTPACPLRGPCGGCPRGRTRRSSQGCSCPRCRPPFLKKS